MTLVILKELSKEKMLDKKKIIIKSEHEEYNGLKTEQKFYTDSRPIIISKTRKI